MTAYELRSQQAENALMLLTTILREMDTAAGNGTTIAINANEEVQKVRRVQENYQADMNHLIERVKNLEQNMPTCRTLQDEHDQLRATIIDCQNKIDELAARLDRAVARINAANNKPLNVTKHGVPVDRVAVLRCISGLWERLTSTVESGQVLQSSPTLSERVKQANELLDLMRYHIGQPIYAYSALSPQDPQDEGQTRKETNE